MTRRDAILPCRAWPAALLVWLALSAATPVVAQDRELPAWDQLDAAQREQLIAPIRERWNSQPQSRARLLRNAQRWQQLTPQQRERANLGMERLRKMTPEQRGQARALFQRMHALPPEQRKALREELKAMSPEQRREWMRRNTGTQTPPADTPPRRNQRRTPRQPQPPSR